jgi:hypothetical protein
MADALSIAAAAAREGDEVCPETVTPLMVCSEAGTRRGVCRKKIVNNYCVADRLNQEALWKISR